MKKSNAILDEGSSVAEFCRLLPTSRRRARSEGWVELLELAEARLLACELPAREVLEDLWTALGLRGVRRRGRSLELPPGQDPVPPPDGAYVCPGPVSGRRCTRVVERGPSEPLPECALHGQPLRFSSP